MKMRKEEYKIKTFEDIIRALRDHPEWLEELRRIILTEELLRLPQRFKRFLQEELQFVRSHVLLMLPM
jgi:hypothetical protein